MDAIRLRIWGRQVSGSARRGSKLAMGSDSQANGDHQAPPAAESAETVEEGETGEVSSDIQANGNHQLPAAVEAVEEGKTGEVSSDIQANGNHQPAAAVEAVEEGETGEVSSDIQANGNHQSPPPAEAVEAVEEGDDGETMEGVASIALLPSGAISGHFIRLPDSICYGLHGTRTHRSSFPSYSCSFVHSSFENCTLSSERETRMFFFLLFSLLSRKTMMLMWQSKKEKVIVVECRGHDAARLQNVDHLHG
ncbi:hypothetical protein PR202_gb19283 [Eleusine coracana subsp. coracana]|uniref:Uncharacterized protein n=1 Tax=Eleusine coracana subsp. coracana TaxID=191504 RepID=A0AAV5F7I8_ELECO|nr:hypothetical protein PR202_gb19283 [Eleusine coracana subsp. coracana]